MMGALLLPAVAAALTVATTDSHHPEPSNRRYDPTWESLDTRKTPCVPSCCARRAEGEWSGDLLHQTMVGRAAC